MIAEPEIHDACDDNLYRHLSADVERNREAFFPRKRHLISRKPCQGEVKQKTASIDEQTKKLFHELAQQWHDETWFVSSIKKRVSHSAYLKIIGLGPAALPLIINELRSSPDYWFAALEAITREDPAIHAEGMDQMRAAWLAWADRQ